MLTEATHRHRRRHPLHAPNCEQVAIIKPFHTEVVGAQTYRALFAVTLGSVGRSWQRNRRAS